MKITVFTSNQARHISLIESLSRIADSVFAIQECNTIFPGQVEDFFRKSDVMKDYFSRVISAEKTIFGTPSFTSENVTQLALKSGDLNLMDLSMLKPALQSDYYIVFGSSYIRGSLCDFLVEHHAYNIHMGVSPYYRGAACNFWAMYDGHPELVGATIHMLDPGIDSGTILMTVFPGDKQVENPFDFTMNSVKTAHEALVDNLLKGRLQKIQPIPQDTKLEIRYSRIRDFTEDVAQDFLRNQPTPEFIRSSLKKRDLSRFYNPYIK